MTDGASDGRWAQFAERLRAEGFAGDITDEIGTRAVYATDNSVYELLPLAVVFPRVPDDLNRIARAASFCGIALAARGGGTGTNGQSLTDSICVDCSRYLTAIEKIDAVQGYAIVQPGVILDQLNRAVSAHGLFFAPTVSTASRATLGGMAATDASGKGSRIYGRTSDHVLQMEVALVDGTTLDTAQPGAMTEALASILAPEAEEIARVFPVMNRGLTGYNLQAAAGGSLVKLMCSVSSRRSLRRSSSSMTGS